MQEALISQAGEKGEGAGGGGGITSINVYTYPCNFKKSTFSLKNIGNVERSLVA